MLPFLHSFYLVSSQIFYFIFFFTPPSKVYLLPFHLTCHQLSFYICLRLHPDLLPARSVGGWKEPRRGGGREREKARTRAALCHSFCFASQRRARRPDSHVRRPVKERGTAPPPVKHCPLLPATATREERYSGGEERLQFTLEPCLCLYNCAHWL